MTRKLTFLILALFALIAGPGWGQSTYTKVTSTSDLTDGQYLIVYETGNVALNGALSSIDVASNTVSVSISNGSIAGNTTIDAAAFTVTHSTDGYSFLGSNNLYICHSGSKNTLNTSESVQWQTVSFNNGDAVINGGGNYTLRYNSSSGQTRFRYYTSGQQAIQLYKKQSAPTHTLTFSTNNGSISAVNGSTQITSGGNVAEGAELNITATANDWYKFSGWSVSGTGSTLGSTTENPTTFTMGTANATLTATFAACVVTVSSNNEGWGIALYDDDSHTISTLAENGYRISTTEPYTIVPADAATLTAGDDDTFVVSGVKDQDVEITINFEAIPTATYTVTFNAGTNGTCSTTELTEAEAGAGVTLPNCTPNAGYQFAGWATTETATEANAGVAGETYYPTESISLYAVYNSVYTITWIVNGTPLTEGEQTTSVVEGEGITTLPTTPSDISEMKFQGWTATQIGTPSATAPTDLFTDAEHAPEITINTTFYAVFAEQSGTGETTYTKLSSNSFETSATYVLAAEESTSSSTLHYFSSYTTTTANESWGVTSTTATDAITFTLSGTASALVAQDASGNYLTPLATGKFRMSSTIQTLNLHNDGTIYNPTSGSTGYNLRYNHNNGSGGFRWYNGTTGTSAYFYKVETSEITYSNYCTTIVEKDLTGISLSGEYPTEFWKGETFSHEGMTVTAHYDDESTKDVTSSATFTGYDMATAGEQTVTVTYDTESTTYNITVKTIANTQENAYTVAEAIALIDDGNDLGTEVYVKGTVSAIVTEFSSDYGNITFDVSADGQTEGQQFRFYRNFKGAEKTPWASAAECPAVGDDVIGLGKLTKYGSTYEFTEGNYIVSLIRVATLSIDDITVSLGGTISPEITSNVPEAERTITYSVASEDVVKVDEEGNLVTVAVGGPVVVTATLTADGYKEATTTFEVEVIKTITSIAVKTAPTTTSYKEGDFFNPAGLVITANYNDESTEDVAYAGNEDKFTFDPSLETALTTGNNSVTITYAGKEATQAISVRALYAYEITWMANGEEHTTTQVTEGDAVVLPENPFAVGDMTFQGWINMENYYDAETAPEYIVPSDIIPTEAMTFYAVFAKAGEGEPEETVFSFNTDNFTEITTSYTTTFTHTFPEATVEAYGVYKNGGIQMNSGKGTYIKNTTAMPGYMSKIVLTWKASGKNSVTMYANANSVASTSSDNLGKQSTTTTTHTINIDDAETKDYKYFYLDGTTVTGACVLTNFSIFYMKATTIYSNFCTTVAPIVISENTVWDGNVTINGNTTVTIGSGAVLTINGALINSNPANLIIKDGAQLIQNSSNVMATIEKNITGYGEDNTHTRDGYYLIANPTERVANDEYDALEGCTQFDLYTFDPTEQLEWRNQVGTASRVPFTRNVGYLFAVPSDRTLSFRGSLLPAGETEITLVRATEGAGIDFPGFNLIGNPFACNAYPTDENGIFMPFYKTNETGSELTLVEDVEAIAPCEGFFVEAEEDGQTVVITTEESEVESSALSLTVSQNRGSVIDRAIVSFNGRSNLHKFMLNPAHTNISLAKNGEEFAAISSEAQGELPVNFKAEKNGSYTITVNTENVEAQYLHLIDNKTGMDTDLLSSSSYTFEAKTSDYASRFKLVFSMTGVEENASTSSVDFAYMSNGNLVIDNIEGEATLQIVDELGRIISTETVSGSYNKALNLKAGLYIINLNGMTQKIVVK